VWLYVLSICLFAYSMDLQMGVLERHVIGQAPFSNGDPRQRHGVGTTHQLLAREIKKEKRSWVAGGVISAV
jgi:hypothetical protein